MLIYELVDKSHCNVQDKCLRNIKVGSVVSLSS